MRAARAYPTQNGSPRIELSTGTLLHAEGLSYRVAAEVCDVLNGAPGCEEVDALSMTIATALGRMGSSLWEAPDWIQIRTKKGKK
jgi:hypothetical protein